jgi:hypothetical protein
MMPTNPVGALAAYGAASPQGVDNLKRLGYQSRRNEELDARKDRRFQLAAQEGQARRERLANRNAPPNPLMGMMQENPELALGMAQLQQSGYLGMMQAQLAQAQLAQQGELGRGELELGRERNRTYGTTQDADRAQRGELAALEQGGRDKALEWEKERERLQLQAQGLGAGLDAQIIGEDEYRQGMTALGGGLGPYQPGSQPPAPRAPSVVSATRQLTDQIGPEAVGELTTISKDLTTPDYSNPMYPLGALKNKWKDMVGGVSVKASRSADTLRQLESRGTVTPQNKRQVAAVLRSQMDGGFVKSLEKLAKESKSQEERDNATYLLSYLRN